jgi:hypothetical protein
MSINNSHSSSHVKTYIPYSRTTSHSWSQKSYLVAHPFHAVSHLEKSVFCVVPQSICKKDVRSSFRFIVPAHGHAEFRPRSLCFQWPSYRLSDISSCHESGYVVNRIKRCGTVSLCRPMSRLKDRNYNRSLNVFK